MWLKTRVRYLLVCLVPFLCIFAVTLIQTNIVFALDGMINHTAVDFNTPNHRRHFHSIDHGDVCAKTSDDSEGCHDLIPDGSFNWDDNIEALINLIIFVGSVIGTLSTLFIYDFINMRFVFSVCIMFPGFLNVLTPTFAKKGGHVSVLIFRFFTGLYTSVLSPAVPMFIQTWFLSTEQYTMNVIVFLGVEVGRMFFVLSGDIITNPSLGWEFLFVMPGMLCVILGFIFFFLVTDDPLENTFISQEEKQIIAADKQWKYTINRVPPYTKTSTKLKINKYMSKIKLMKCASNRIETPWYDMVTDRNFLLSVLQFLSQSWVTPVMVLMIKKYLEEIHGYSIREAAFMVTIPTNLSQIVIGWVSGVLGDWTVKQQISPLLVRRAGALVCSLCALPFLILPFLPCEVVQYRTVVLGIQIFGSIKVFGNLAGYTSFRELSPTFNRQLFGVASLLSNTVPGIMVPVFMSAFKTSTRSSWTKNFLTNAFIMIIGNWIYAIFIRAEMATWDPKYIQETDTDPKDTIVCKTKIVNLKSPCSHRKSSTSTNSSSYKMETLGEGTRNSVSSASPNSSRYKMETRNRKTREQV